MKNNNEKSGIDFTVDASNYISVIAHDGRSLFTLWLDPASITAAQVLGQGKYDETQPPVLVYRLTYQNGMVEDVLDKWGVLEHVSF